jgi:exonuclease VII small subunit
VKAESPEQPGPPPQLDALLDQLEVLIGRLADPNAPLNRLVADFEAASRLVEAAQAQLAAAADRIAQQER